MATWLADARLRGLSSSEGASNASQKPAGCVQFDPKDKRTGMCGARLFEARLLAIQANTPRSRSHSTAFLVGFGLIGCRQRRRLQTLFPSVFALSCSRSFRPASILPK
jgi:hypothetical protein